MFFKGRSSGVRFANDYDNKRIFYDILSGAILSILIFCMYLDVITGIISEWLEDPNYSHGFLIPLISAGLLYRDRESLSNVHRSPSTYGLFVLASGLLLFSLGQLAAEIFTIRISMLILIGGAIISLYGMPFYKGCILPHIYLFFMIPLPYLIYNFVAFPLKLFVAKYSVLILQWMNVPVYREGNIIMLPHTILEVADACSGIRSLLSLFAFSVAYTIFFNYSRQLKAILILSTVPIAVCANALRVIGTGILAQFYGSRAAEGFFHEFAGMAIFSFSLLLFLSLNSVLTKIR